MKSPEQHNQEGGETMKIKISPDLEATVQMAEVAALVSVRENCEIGIDIPGFPGKKIGTPESMSAVNGSLLAVVEVSGERLFVYQL